MSGLEMMMMVLFVIPMVLACAAFILCAMWIQVKEEQRNEAQIQSAPVHRRARRAAYHAA